MGGLQPGEKERKFRGMQYLNLPWRSRALMLSASAVLLFTAACSKKAVAVKPPAPPQNQTAQDTSTPAPQRSFANNSNSNTRRPLAANNGTMSPAERKTLLNESLARMEDALFDYDTATIRPDAMKALQEDVTVIKTTLAKYPAEVVKIEGHCDERGSAEYNLALGDRRGSSQVNFSLTWVSRPPSSRRLAMAKSIRFAAIIQKPAGSLTAGAHLVAENTQPAR